MSRYRVEPAYETITRQLYSASPGNHVVTTRWTYTVPAGRYAVLQQAFVLVGPSPAADDGAVLIYVASAGGVELHRVLDIRSDTVRLFSDHAEPKLVLAAGEILRAQTANGSAGTIVMEATAQLIEILL